MIDELLLSDLLLIWENRFEQGEDLPASELCSDCPELAPALADRIQSLKRFARVTPSGGRDSDSPLSNGPILPATLAGRYRLDERIAEGGFGEVWRGFDMELQRLVAIKVPKRSRLAQPLEDFLDEARKLARLKHPGIVPVYDVGRHDGASFIVSELIDGQDLGALLRRKWPSVRETVRVSAEVARHLHHAHRQGFIHRDIKPANILVDAQERVFITDFGIALTEEALRRNGDNGCGTLAYMSPEQLHGDLARIDCRTDLYSLGVVLFQLLTRQLPFEADTPEGIRTKILHQEPPPPRSLQKGLPKEVERICRKCLAKSPANRYPSAEALANDLTRWLNRRRTNWLAVAAMLSLMGLLLLWLWPRFGVASPTANDPVGIPSELLGHEEMLFNGQDLSGWVEFNPDGGTAFGVGANGVLRLKGGPKGYLRTKQTFADFVLRLDYLLPEGGRVTGLGSGILLRMAGHDRLKAKYLEANIGKGNSGDIWWAAGKRQTRRRLFNERPIGEWNEYVIVCVGDKLTLILNGQIVNEVKGLERKPGYVGIIAQGTDVWFRNLRISTIKTHEEPNGKSPFR